MGRTVTFVNQKGGVGKSTVTLGLASAAWAAGHRVLVVDLDPQGASTWVLGLDPTAVELSSAEVLSRNGVNAIVASAWGDAVHVLPASPRLQHKEHPSGKDAALRMRSALSTVKEQYDAVLIDCPPSLGNLTTNGLVAADHAVIVVEPAALGLRGINAVADAVDSVWDSHNPDLDLAGIIVNKVPSISAEADRQAEELGRIASKVVGKKAIWQPAIPQRVIVNQALGERWPIHAYAKGLDVADVFDKLWAKLRRVTKG